MKNSLLIFSVLIYILFALVYPVVHLHAHEHHDHFELQLSVHPPEYPVQNSTHAEGHHQTDTHEHQDHHLEADWDCTPISKIINTKYVEQWYFIPLIPDLEEITLNRQPQDIPLKLPQHYLPGTLPNRAPPLSV